MHVHIYLIIDDISEQLLKLPVDKIDDGRYSVYGNKRGKI